MRVHLFKHSYHPFCEMLRANGIDFIENEAMLSGYRSKWIGEVFAGPYTIEILASASVLASLASVLKAWIRARASRKVQIGNSGFMSEGLSPDEVVKLLKTASTITVMETKPQDGEEVC